MTKLNISQVIKNTEAEGPGKRYAIWFQGCTLNCSGCCNPEMLPSVPKHFISPKDMVVDALKQNVEGVSILGGEPFQQPKGLSVLCKLFKKHNLSIMIYSGYTLEELYAKDNEFINSALKSVDILVAGRYERESRTTTRRWIGSTNQKVHFLTNKYKNDKRFQEENSMEIRFTPNERLVVINGFPVFNARKINKQQTKRKK